MPLDLMMSQNSNKNEIIIAPKKIHFDTSGGIDASALIAELPMTSNDTIRINSIQFSECVLEKSTSRTKTYLLCKDLQYKPQTLLTLGNT